MLHTLEGIVRAEVISIDHDETTGRDPGGNSDQQEQQQPEDGGDHHPQAGVGLLLGLLIGRK